MRCAPIPLGCVAVLNSAVHRMEHPDASISIRYTDASVSIQ